MNPDGIHWGFECHRRIADEVVPVVEALRTGGAGTQEARAG